MEDGVAEAIGEALDRSERGQASVGGGGDPEAEALALSWRAGLVAGTSSNPVLLTLEYFS